MLPWIIHCEFGKIKCEKIIYRAPNLNNSQGEQILHPTLAHLYKYNDIQCMPAIPFFTMYTHIHTLLNESKMLCTFAREIIY